MRKASIELASNALVNWILGILFLLTMIFLFSSLMRRCG
jgi:hypothetical protein